MYSTLNKDYSVEYMDFPNLILEEFDDFKSSN